MKVFPSFGDRSVKDQEPPRRWMYPTLSGESINWLDARVLSERAGAVAGHAASLRLHIQHIPRPENHWLPPNLFPAGQQGQVIPPSSWHKDVQVVQE